MLYYYQVNVKGWSVPYVFACTMSWPNGTYVLVQAQNPRGMYGENHLVKGRICSEITEKEADSFLNGRSLKEVVCAISEEEYQNDDIRLSNREIKARMQQQMKSRERV